jgi:hypothetical protein
VAKAKANNPDPPMKRRIKPSKDPAVRESQLISIAIERVEQRILDGTASAQELVHLMKLGSQEKRLELEKLELEKQLLQAKTEAINATKENAAMFAEAIAAMASYRPPTYDDEEDEE